MHSLGFDVEVIAKALGSSIGKVSLVLADSLEEPSKDIR